MPKWTVVITEPINEAGVRFLEQHNVEVIHLPPGSKESALLDITPKAAGFITRGGVKVNREIMVANPNLKVIGVLGIGCDHVDLVAAKDLGKVVINTPDALTVTVAEMAIAMMLSMTRRIALADRAVRTGGWTRKYSDLIGVELMGKTIGFVGLGRIGAATARRLKAFEVKLLYWSRTRHPDLEFEIGLEWAELPSLLARSDILSLHVPGTTETHHLIGDAELSLMKRGAMIVNTARGRIIDEAALVKALRNGQISFAALDVFEKEPIVSDNPLLTMDNVVIAPHLGASSIEAMRRMAIQVAQGVIDVLEGREPKNSVS
ncbi:MAG: hydroxyacid dehydrogenase [Candidatus Bathyarchaeota archaeon]|nr:hydroxyacid dehydrogenase [Candidatus Bathyarchaeota archaeon]